MSKKGFNWAGGIIFGLCLIGTFMLIGLILWGFWSLWLALAAYHILGIIVFVILIIVAFPIIILLFIIAIIPAVIGLCAIDR